MRRAAPLLLVAGCAGAYPIPPHPPGALAAVRNVYDVDGHLFRSAQPSRAELAALVAQLRIDLVVQLDASWEAAADVPPAGVRVVRVVRVPLPVLAEPSAEDLARIAATIDQAVARGERVLVHCLHGEDRTGLIVALYRVRRGVPVDVAWADAERHGFHRYRGLWRAWSRAAGWPHP